MASWTVDTLKELQDEKIRSLTESLKEFRETVLARFIQVNEFRGALDDLGKQMATRRELEATKEQYDAQIVDLSKQLGELRSRIDVGPVGLQQVQTSQHLSQGRGEGMASMWGYIIGAIGIISFILSYLLP